MMGLVDDQPTRSGRFDVKLSDGRQQLGKKARSLTEINAKKVDAMLWSSPLIAG